MKTRLLILRNSLVKSFLLLILLAGGETNHLRAQEVDEEKALKVKVAYLINFAKFIDWPADAFEDENDPIVIGVVNSESYAKQLQRTVSDKTIGGRPVKVERIILPDRSPQGASTFCHVLFLPVAANGRADAFIKSRQNGPTLLVSDIADFARDGGMIGFVLENGRIVFEINRQRLEERRLKASAKLLKLAKLVENNDRP